MPPVAFHLLIVPDEAKLLSHIKTSDQTEQPLYLGRCHHWMHSPKLSTAALTGEGPDMLHWTHLLVSNASTANPLSLPQALSDYVQTKWTIVAPVEDSWLSTLKSAQPEHVPKSSTSLPEGWSPDNYAGLDAAVVPADLEASLNMSSIPLGGNKTSAPQDLKSFMRTWGVSHRGSVDMFNLLAYHSGQQARYFQYIAAFQASVGSRYGGDALLLGSPVTDWSSRVQEGFEAANPAAGGSEVWENVALVHYPSLWHFGKMLDDPEYAEVDRAYKQGALKDNPLICCTRIEL